MDNAQTIKCKKCNITNIFISLNDCKKCSRCESAGKPDKPKRRYNKPTVEEVQHWIHLYDNGKNIQNIADMEGRRHQQISLYIWKNKALDYLEQLKKCRARSGRIFHQLQEAQAECKKLRDKVTALETKLREKQ